MSVWWEVTLELLAQIRGEHYLIMLTVDWVQLVRFQTLRSKFIRRHKLAITVSRLITLSYTHYHGLTKSACVYFSSYLLRYKRKLYGRCGDNVSEIWILLLLSGWRILTCIRWAIIYFDIFLWTCNPAILIFNWQTSVCVFIWVDLDSMFIRLRTP